MKHAVLTDTHVYWISEQARKVDGCKLPIHAQHVSELWAMGQELGIRHFWVMPASPIDGMGYSFLSEKDGYDIFIASDGEERPEHPFSASCKKDAFEVYVNYPASEPFGWTVNHPLDVLACIDYLEQLLGVEVKWSPPAIGRALLRKMYSATKRLQSYLDEPTVDLLALPFKSAAPELMFLNKQWFTSEMIGKWFHLYDKNAAHPTAASMVTTGIGDPVHLTDNIVDPKKPGAYRVKFSSKGSQFDGVTLPKIIASEWVTLAVLKYAVKMGYDVQIEEAYVFEHGYRLFEKWAPMLWEARQALKDEVRFRHPGGRENAYWTVKNIMNFTISSYAEHKNWWADMVGQSRAAKLANMAKWAEDGYRPVMVYSDDMGFLSDDPNPVTAVPGMMDRQEKMGGYKCKFSVQLTADMIADLQKMTKVGSVHTYLKRAAERTTING